MTSARMLYPHLKRFLLCLSRMSKSCQGLSWRWVRVTLPYWPVLIPIIPFSSPNLQESAEHTRKFYHLNARLQYLIVQSLQEGVANNGGLVVLGMLGNAWKCLEMLGNAWYPVVSTLTCRTLWFEHSCPLYQRHVQKYLGDSQNQTASSGIGSWRRISNSSRSETQQIIITGLGTFLLACNFLHCISTNCPS